MVVLPWKRGKRYPHVKEGKGKISNKTNGENDSDRTRVAITGTGGRLGGALARIYSEFADVVRLARSSLDLRDGDTVRDTISALPFDVLINPAAMTSVDQCESEVDAARAVNTEAPRIMASICREREARFIHVSTDYVFDGKSPGLRSETDLPNPFGVYGQTKLAGELAVLEEDPSALVVRTSWVFGPERPAFPDSIVKRALVQDRVEAIADKWSAPTYSDDFAGWLVPLLDPRSVSGLLHLCNSGACSWQEYGQVALDVASELGLNLKTRKVEPLLLRDMTQFVVPRPVHTAMDLERYGSLGFGVPRSWDESLGDYLRRQVKAGVFDPK